MVVDVFYIVCRSHAIACVNQFIVTRTQALMVHIGTFIEVETFFFSEFCFKSALGFDTVQVDESFFL